MNLRDNLYRNLALSLLLAFVIIVGPASANPFDEKSQVTISEGTALDASEALFNKAQKGEAKDDSKDKPVLVAVLSDLHCRPANNDSLQRAIKAINKMSDVYATAITGDLVEKIGSPAEYKYMIKALSHLSVPILAVPGNHDVQYKDYYNPNKNAKNPKLRTTPKERKAKLERFKNSFKLKSLRYYRKVGGHLLVFLPDDDLESKTLVRISETSLKFLKETLKSNKSMPTIVFFHGPLLGSYNRKGGLSLTQATIQPSAKVRNILKDNPQVFLWVSGHVHMGPSSNNFCAKVNKVGKVTNIHTPAIQPGSSYVQVLKLSPKQAVVRTYNAKTGKFIKKFDRVFKHKIAEKDKEKEEKKDEPTVTQPVKEDDDQDEENSTEQEESDLEEPDVKDDSSASTEVSTVPGNEEEVDEDPESEDNSDPVSSEELEETENEPDDSAIQDGADNQNDADGEEAKAAIERIRELISIAMEYINNLFTNFIRILRP